MAMKRTPKDSHLNTAILVTLEYNMSMLMPWTTSTRIHTCHGWSQNYTQYEPVYSKNKAL